jgi:hypothetical protein
MITDGSLWVYGTSWPASEPDAEVSLPQYLAEYIWSFGAMKWFPDGTEDTMRSHP